MDAPVLEETQPISQIDVINQNLDAYIGQLIQTIHHVNDNHLPNFYENQVQIMPEQEGLNNNSSPQLQIPDSREQFEKHKEDSQKQLEELLGNIDQLDDPYKLSTGAAGQAHVNSLYNQVWAEELKSRESIKNY